MKMSKRLLAVMMVVVMALTLVPLGMFAFAEDPAEDGTAAHPYIIDDLVEFKAFLEGIKTYPSYTKVDSATVNENNYKTFYVKKIAGYKLATDEKWNDKVDYYTLDAVPTYPSNACYKLSTTGKFDVVGVWFDQATSAEKIKVSEILKINTKDVYTPATEADKEGTTVIYLFDGENYTEVPAADKATLDLDPTKHFTKSTGWDEASYADIDTTAKRDALIGSSDLDIEPIEITPAKANFGESFSFDGSNQVIAGINFNGNDSLAMFNGVSKGNIKDFTIDACNFNCAGSQLASVVIDNRGTVENVKSNAVLTITNNMTTSGVVAAGIAVFTSSSSTINNCKFNGKIYQKVNTESFSGTEYVNDLSDIDARIIVLSGIVVSNLISEANRDTHFTGNNSDAATFDTQYIYGPNEIINGVVPTIPTYKTVGSDTEATNPGDTTVSDWSTNKYQLVKTADGKYYARYVTCTHEGFAHVDKVPATCAKEGKEEYYYCDTCKKYFLTEPNKDTTNVRESDLVIPKTEEHTGPAVKVDAKAATCAEAGNIEYWQCDTCKAKFADQELTQTVTDVTIAKLPHSFTNYVYNNNATTTKDGTETAKCDNCDATHTRTKAGTKIPSVQIKSSTGYYKTGDYVVTSNPATKSGISVASFKGSLQTYTYIVRNESGTEITSGIVKTGYTVEVSGQPASKMTIVVLGDVNKDGVISSLDYVRVKNIILKKFTPDTITSLAANANGDRKISSLDYVRIKNIILNSK